MSKIDDTLNELGIDGNSLPSGLAARKRKYDRLHSEFMKAVDEAGEDDFDKLQELEASVEDYGEDLAEALVTLGEKRAEKAEKERLKEERRKAREAKRKEKEAAAKQAEEAAAKQPEATTESSEDAEPETEPAKAAAPTAAKPEAEMANATGEEVEQVEAEVEEPTEEKEESSGVGLGSILIGGLVLLTTFGAYNYFKRR
jgi:cobalamin biosynthesis Mg chelatase CobN